MSLKTNLKEALANEVNNNNYLKRSLKQAHSTILRLSIEKQKSRSEIAELKRQINFLIKQLNTKETDNELQEKQPRD